MKASRGEIKIFQILQESGLEFAEEYSFPDLVSNTGRPLRFDFAVFEKQQYNDMKKREYCRDHNITLVIIPYWDEARVNYDYILDAAGY